MDEPENTSESTVLLNTKEDKGVPKTARARKVSPSSKAKDSIPASNEIAKPTASKTTSKRPLPDPSPLVPLISRHLGLLVMLVLVHKWATYLQTIHENQYWFSNIREVEREISFRTENGLYYSYFKQLARSPSLWQGFKDLKADNLTEHGNTINILGRFNIHQELIAAVLYRVYSFGMTPVMFYVNVVFSLQGLFLAAKFLITWHISGSWLAGVLTTVYVVVHRDYVTRVISGIALREQFSMPFVFGQFLMTGLYLEKTKTSKKDLAFIFAASFGFNLTWQFGPIILFLQSIVLFYLAVIDIFSRNVVCKILVTNLLSALGVWCLQYYQSIIPSSLFVSFVPIACIILQGLGGKDSTCQQQPSDDEKPPTDAGGAGSGRAVKKLGQSFVILGAAILGTLVFNQAIKVAFGQNADNHILDFVYDKLGINKDETNFETRLYLCLPAFQPVQLQYFNGFLEQSNALWVYALSVIVLGSAVAITSLTKWFGFKPKSRSNGDPKAKPAAGATKSKAPVVKRGKFDHKVESWLRWIDSKPTINFVIRMDERPSLCFHLVQSIIFAILGFTTQRMLCFWIPYVCIFAACTVASDDFWNVLLKGRPVRKVLRSVLTMIIIAAVVKNNKSRLSEELEDLREFYDPDTVDLMDWINAETPADAAFTASMQLNSAVRLSTFRPITNHPHFEDKALRDRTKELYKIYGRVSPLDAYETLIKYNTSYIILEDSICIGQRDFRDRRCTTNEIVDLSMGHIPEDGIRRPITLVQARYPRFCDEIRYGSREYTSYFKLVFSNRTFRVYKLTPPRQYELS